MMWENKTSPPLPSLPPSTSVAWFAFTVCMSAGVSTLNNYTKNVLMVGPRRLSALNPCSFNFFLPPYYTPASTSLAAAAAPPSPPRISHLSPYYEPPTTVSTGRLARSRPQPFHHSESFPPQPSHAESSSPFHRLSLPSQPSAAAAGPRYEHDEDYSPL